MKKRTLTQLASILLVLCMLLGISSLALAENTADLAGNLYASGYPIVKEKESFSILMNNSGSPDDMLLFQTYETLTNMGVKWQMYDYDTCVEKKNLMYSSGDYPDAVATWCLSDSDILTYGGDVYIPVEELIAKYAPNITKALDTFPGARAALTAPDGHIYGFAIMGPQADCSWIMHINTAWLKNLKLEIPETIEDFEKVLIAFKEQDANQNGDQNDEIPLSFNAQNYLAMFGAFGRLDNVNHLVVEDGKVVFTANKAEYKAAVEWFKKLYDQGLLDPEVFTQDSVQFATKGKDERGSLYGVFIDYMGENTVGTERYADEYRALAPLEGPTGKRIWSEGDTWIFRNMMAITSAAANPTSIVRWIDGLYEPEMSYQICYGMLGEWTEKRADGTYGYAAFPEGVTEQDVRNNYTVSAMPYCILPEFDKQIEKAAGSLLKAASDSFITPYVTSEPWPRIWLTAAQNDELAIIQNDLLKLVDDKLVQWITGQSDLNADWDAYCETLTKMGVEKYQSIYAQAVETYYTNAK